MKKKKRALGGDSDPEPDEVYVVLFSPPAFSNAIVDFLKHLPFKAIMKNSS